MDKTIEAQRWPHKCKVYYLDGETSFDDGKERIIYEGKCYKYESTNMRVFQTNGVIKSDYGIDMPVLLKGVSGGCLLDVEDDCGTMERCEIASCSPVRYGRFVGTTIYFNKAKN